MISTFEPNHNRNIAALWALRMVQNSFVVLDTETTGLNRDRADQVIEIAILSDQGEVLINQRVSPTVPIPKEASRIHGIFAHHVMGKPTWAQIRPKLLPHIHQKRVIIYNEQYDVGIIGNSDRAMDGDQPERFFAHSAVHCAMSHYAAFYGDWNNYHNSYRWQSLTNACKQCGIDTSDIQPHAALGDCMMTLRLVLYMASWAVAQGISE